MLQRIGNVVYKLDLPEGSRVHPVLHVSQLKKHVLKDQTASEELTSVSTDPMLVQQPERIVATREILRGAKRVKQVLVKWSLMPEHMATWEDEADIAPEQVQVSTN